MTSFAAQRFTTGSRRARFSLASLVGVSGAGRTPRRTGSLDSAQRRLDTASSEALVAMSVPRF